MKCGSREVVKLVNYVDVFDSEKSMSCSEKGRGSQDLGQRPIDGRDVFYRDVFFTSLDIFCLQKAWLLFCRIILLLRDSAAYDDITFGWSLSMH